MCDGVEPRCFCGIGREDWIEVRCVDHFESVAEVRSWGAFKVEIAIVGEVCETVDIVVHDDESGLLEGPQRDDVVTVVAIDDVLRTW